MLAQESEVFPSVAVVGKDRLCPLHGCSLHVFFNFFAVLLFELLAKDRIGEPDCDTDLVGPQERAVSVTLVNALQLKRAENKSSLPVVHVTGSPAQGKRVQCDKQRRKAGPFGTPEDRRCNVVMLVTRPVELEPPRSLTIRFRDVFDTGGARCAHDKRHVASGSCTSCRYFTVGIEDACENNSKPIWGQIGDRYRLLKRLLTLYTDRCKRHRVL